MNSITLTLESNLISFSDILNSLNNECIDLYQYYWGTNCSTLIGGVSSSLPVTTAFGGSLLQSQFVGGITLLTEVVNFFGNSAVGTSSYLQYADKLINGSTVISSPLSQDVENIGNRLQKLGTTLILSNKQVNNYLKSYNSSGLSSFIGSLNPYQVIYGCNLTQSRFLSGIVLLQQFQNFLNGNAVVTGDYYSTITQLVNGS